MKIGITCYATYGGSGVVATELGKCLAQRGHEIHFITQDIPFRLEHTFNERIIFHQVESMDYPLFGESPYTLSLASKMVQVVEDENLDLLHVHYAIPHATSAYLAQQMLKGKRNLPIVTTLHGTDITLVGQDPTFYNITKFSIENSTVVTTVSDFLKDQTLDKFDIKNEIHRVYNFVDSQLFTVQEMPCRKRLGVHKDQVVFVHLSNFRPVKRSYDVIHAFNLIVKEHPEAVLLMAGEGPLMPECRRLVREYGLQEKVQFLGKVQDIVSLLNMSDVMLFPSELESFGLAALEASACGIPVLASRSGGTGEAVLDEVTGFLFEVGDYQSMAKKGIELAKDCKLRNTIGMQGRERVENEFSPEIIIPQYEYLYREAMSKVSK